MLDSFSRPRAHNVVHGTSNLYGFGIGILVIEGYDTLKDPSFHQACDRIRSLLSATGFVD